MTDCCTKSKYSPCSEHGHHHQSTRSDSIYSASVCGATAKLIDAHFNFCRRVTHATLDCLEAVLDCVFPKDCEPTGNHRGYSYHESFSGCVDDMCCTIPEPCWMPKSVGEYCCEICDGGKASLTVWLTNEDFRPQTYRIERRGDLSGRVSIHPSTLTLGPKERAKITITFDAPASPGHVAQACYDLLIWIDSCRDYYLRWVLHTRKHPKPCCVELAIADQPDYITHWYDHFYCLKPCTGQKAEPERNLAAY